MQCFVQRNSKRNIQKEKIETDKRRKHFFHTFLYLLGEWTNQRYVPRRSVVPKAPDSKVGVVGSTSLPEKVVGSQKTWVFISLHRLQIRYSKILLILARPLPIGYFTFYYFSFFLIFNRMDAWSLMRGDAFIHFVSVSRRVNIRLGVLLLIPKSPQSNTQTNTFFFIIKGFWTLVFIFIVISTTFRSICPPAFFRCLSNSGTFKELRTTSFIQTTRVACSDSVSHNPRAFNKGRSLKFRKGSRVRQTPEEGRRTYWPNRCGNNYNKDEDNNPKTLND